MQLHFWADLSQERGTSMVQFVASQRPGYSGLQADFTGLSHKLQIASPFRTLKSK